MAYLLFNNVAMNGSTDAYDFELALVQCSRALTNLAVTIIIRKVRHIPIEFP